MPNERVAWAPWNRSLRLQFMAGRPGKGPANCVFAFARDYLPSPLCLCRSPAFYALREPRESTDIPRPSNLWSIWPEWTALEQE